MVANNVCRGAVSRCWPTNDDDRRRITDVVPPPSAAVCPWDRVYLELCRDLGHDASAISSMALADGPQETLDHRLGTGSCSVHLQRLQLPTLSARLAQIEDTVPAPERVRLGVGDVFVVEPSAAFGEVAESEAPAGRQGHSRRTHEASPSGPSR